ncbi:MAG: hypothetical protein D6744_07435 [Planctomycetota bacterium]|nr:MAG: hypothetical protein D6744_07435 [Planctomycetota bacterium]
MNVRIKKFEIEMELKNKGVELEIRDTKNVFLGDLVVTKTKLIWCRGKTSPKNGKGITWDKFIKYMETL